MSLEQTWQTTETSRLGPRGLALGDPVTSRASCLQTARWGDSWLSSSPSGASGTRRRDRRHVEVTVSVMFKKRLFGNLFQSVAAPPRPAFVIRQISTFYRLVLRSSCWVFCFSCLCTPSSVGFHFFCCIVFGSCAAHWATATVWNILYK